MIREVVKGADDEIEFIGFKGRYFNRLIFMVLGLVGFTFLAYGFGLNSLIFFFVMFGIGTAGFFYIKHEMGVNKKFGHIHKTHKAPKAIVQNQQFFKMIKK
ncbi:DUF4133 domain-containing protein [Dyadobacter alkalitolerans]|uniref:DUF4133 domain-containing protein n=1 Tax=Dyadobacter alkalitolerans TaxID=492736 RepID=UPI00047B2BA1|nr:DUF4133 domain-containing protein [Dyadobacter alkalitolerans]